MDEENTFKFIVKVQTNECLWSSTSKAYRHKLLRDKTWNSIGNEFQMTGDAAYAYFRKLREKFRREVDKTQGRNGAAPTPQSDWPFFGSLQFLNDVYKKRKLNNSQTWDFEEAGLCVSIEDDSTDNTPPSLKGTPYRSSLRSRSKTPGETETMAEILRENTAKMIEAINGAPASKHEDVLTFIRGTLNALPSDEAIELEKDIMKLCMKYRYKK